MDKRALAWLSVSHLFNDLNQGAVPALLPFLIAERGLTYTAAGGLVLAATLLSSVVQPALGHASDRRPLPWLMPLGVLTGGAGIAATGFVSGYGVTAACVLLSGLGVAAFHPESARYANYVSGARRATGMSIFSVGGNLGLALGPVAVTASAAWLGLRGVTLLAIPAAAMALLLARELPRLKAWRPVPAPARPAGADTLPRWGAFGRLGGVIVFRSLFSFGLMTFIPIYFVKVRGIPNGRASLTLTLMLLSGALATLAGGRLADRIGRRAVMLGSLLPLAPLILLFTRTTGLATLFCVVLLGAFTVASYSVAVVMGQEYLPGREGIAGGVTMGLAIGMGGAGVPLLGLVADRSGPAAVMPILAVLPLLAATLAATLPDERAAVRRAVPTAA